MSLHVEHINKSFGQVQAIKDLSMEVEEGALFGFLGANGAGKTTTMRMILDLLRPDSGQIIWNGIAVRQVARRSFGYLPEERGLYPKLLLVAKSKPSSQAACSRSRLKGEVRVCSGTSPRNQLIS